MQELRRKSRIVSEGAGVLDILNPDGEIIGTLSVPSGVHLASVYLDLLEPGQTLEIGAGCFALPPRQGAFVAEHPLALQSDANPAFQPTSASRLEREMRIELNEMRNARLALQKEARKTQADRVEVVETIPDAQTTEPPAAEATA